MKNIKKRIIAIASAAAISASCASAYAANGDKTITLTIGDPNMTVDGVEKSIDNEGTVPIIENDRTMLPLRAVLEELGATVEWDGETRTVTIKKENGEQMSDPNLAKRVTPEEEGHIFELSDEVTREHVYYKNRYGIELAGDLYAPKNINKEEKQMAVVIGPPFGGVKEQGPGVYANELAKRGFVALTFDPSFNGASGGEYRHVASTDIFAEDFSAGVDFLGSLDYVDRERIGAVGICASGGFVLGAAAVDARIKAVVTSAMYDIPGFGNSMDNESWQASIASLAEQRWADVDNGYPAYTPMYEADKVYDEVPEGWTGNNYEFFQFYGMKRGHHARSTGGATGTSNFSFNNFPVTYHIDKISPRPILFITGDIAHSRAFSEAAYAAANEPKELYVVDGAMHIDLYDDTAKIPFDKIESFLKDALVTDSFPGNGLSGKLCSKKYMDRSMLLRYNIHI